MNRNRIRLTESQLQRVIKKSVKKILREDVFPRPQNDISSNLAERINIARNELYDLYKYALRELQDNNNKYLKGINKALISIDAISNSACTNTD